MEGGGGEGEGEGEREGGGGSAPADPARFRNGACSESFNA